MESIKKSISAYLKAKDIDQIKKILDNSENLELLELISGISLKEQITLYKILSNDRAKLIFPQLDIRLQQELIKSFTDDEIIEIMATLAPDDRVRFLEELTVERANRLISYLPIEERQMTKTLMTYKAETAGRIMTPKYACVNRGMTVFEALDRVRSDAKDKETIYTLYITNKEGVLEGVISLRELLMADSSEKIENIMQQNIIKVTTSTDQEEVARLLQKLDLLAIPVVDNQNYLVGIITFDDAMDILEDEATEDMFDKVAIGDINKKETNRSAVLIKGSILDIWKVRLPFLIITLCGGLLAGSVIDSFEQALKSVAVVAIFIPVIMDMGGNVGTQSSTVFARGALLGHIKMNNIGKHILKEMLVGLSMGALVGAVCGLIAYIWQGIPGLGLAVGLSIVFTMTLASFLGFIVPYILMKLNVDQAAGTDLIITSIKDIAGLMIYFVLVNHLLSHLM